MGGGDHAHSRRRDWGERPPGFLRRLFELMRIGRRPASQRRGLRELPIAMRRGDLAEAYLAAEAATDHPRAGAAAAVAADRAVADEAWWAADVWAHRALWHFEHAGMTLQAARQARRIGDLRSAAGDPASARRYYAEAIDEARDIGAEHEQGLASLGLGRALMDLGDVTAARRLGAAAVELLDRAAAPESERADARGLRGTELAVGERLNDEEEA